MKAEKLMIGDYVAVTPSGMTIRIAAVHQKKVAYHACTNKLAWVRRELVNPILITTEILEKNGFVYRKDSGAFIVYAEEAYSNQMVEVTLFDVESEFRNIQLHICESNSPQETMLHLMECNCVHQLQHVLRLCGIEKEIEL